MLRNRSLLLASLVAVASVSSAQPPVGYYDATAGLSGAALRGALHETIDEHDVHSYDDARDFVQILDEDPSNANNVLLIYSRASVAKTTWPDFNREHLWPQSRGANRRPARSDMHHIYAADQNVNSSRGSKFFDDCEQSCRSHAESPLAEYDNDSWEPPGEVKGDIARAMLYMDIRYEGGNGEPDLELINGATSSGCNCMSRLQTLLAWHLSDPVDARERARHEGVFEIQGNRNPFIDHPEWVSQIWGGPSSGPGPGPPPPIGGLSENEMQAHFIDVGQGDATLLEFPCGAILIDAGGQNNATTTGLLDYLDQFFTRRTDLNRTLESIIVTHNHVDHTRALREVVEAGIVVNRFIEHGMRGGYWEGDLDVDWVVANAQTGGRNIQVTDVDDALVVDTTGYTDTTIDPVSCAQVDPVITMLSADLATNPGWSWDDYGNKNSHSIVLRVDFGESSFLFTGDLEEAAIGTMVDFYLGSDMLDVDVYQVGHHGSYNGTTEELMEATSPEMAIISMSSYTDRRSHTAYQYGHPRTSAVERLKDGVTGQRLDKTVRVASAVRSFYSEVMRHAIYATGWDGTVVVRASSDGSKSVPIDQ